MPRLVLTYDEVYPVFDMYVPEEGEESNIECTSEFFQDFIKVSNEYNKYQKALKYFYEQQKRKGVSFDRYPSKTSTETIAFAKQQLRPVLPKNTEGVCGASQTPQ